MTKQEYFIDIRGKSYNQWYFAIIVPNENSYNVEHGPFETLEVCLESAAYEMAEKAREED
jgi:hypothetical protein